MVDGTVFVGSSDDSVYALDAATGDQQWAFETGSGVFSSPTVVDGTVFVGSSDDNVYALDTDVVGSSEGSRVMFGTLGHHNGWRHANQTIDDPDTDDSDTEEDDSGDEPEDDSGAAPEERSLLDNTRLVLGGAGALTLTAVGGYAVIRGSGSNDEEGDSDEELERSVEELFDAAKAATDNARTAREGAEYETAGDAYAEALELYAAVQDKLDEDDEDEDQSDDLEATIETLRSEQSAVESLHRIRSELRETLGAAEGTFQTGIAAHANNKGTVARLRYRQARNSFESALEEVDESEDLEHDPFGTELEVAVQAGGSGPPTKLSRVPGVSDANAEALAEAGFETIDDLQDDDSFRDVEGLDEKVAARLTALSWWHGDESFSFTDRGDIERRIEQAGRGFEAVN